MQVETEERLPKRFIAHEYEWGLNACDEGAAERVGPQVLAAGDVHIVEVDIGQQRIARIRGAHAADADRRAAGERAAGGRVDHDQRRVGQSGGRKAIEDGHGVWGR